MLVFTGESVMLPDPEELLLPVQIKELPGTLTEPCDWGLMLRTVPEQTTDVVVLEPTGTGLISTTRVTLPLGQEGLVVYSSRTLTDISILGLLPAVTVTLFPVLEEVIVPLTTLQTYRVAPP